MTADATPMAGRPGGTIPLTGLEGGNPLSFLAALGVLDVCDRAGLDVRLSWTDDLVPTAVLHGSASVDQVLDRLDDDRALWVGSAVLTGPPDHPLTDAKPSRAVLREWAEMVGAVLRPPITGGTAQQDLFTALVAEGATDTTGRGTAKPTHLHFSAGQQQFLRLARDLASTVDRNAISNALTGPWTPDPAAKTFGWNAGGERVFAFRATDPSSEKRPGFPGPDWLAFRGLVFLPVSTRQGRDALALTTTGCEVGWKTSSFRWPLWASPIGAEEARSLIGSVVPQPVRQRGHALPLAPRDVAELSARGVTRIFRAPISRSDQGGYGSFGGADVELEVTAAVREP